MKRRAQPTPPTGVLGPESMEVHERRLRAGENWCRSFYAVDFPREVGPGWLSPLVGVPAPVDVALHVEPIPNDVAAIRLRRQRARFESTRRMDSRKERLVDPTLEAAAGDADDLAAAIARGESRLFNAGLYVTVRADDEEQLEAEARKVSSLTSSLLLDTAPATYRSAEGWLTTLPLGIDAIGARRAFDTRALAASFPFASSELNHSGGILLGRNLTTGSLVFVDRFALENHNQVILARSGAGKSYLAKLTILRSLYRGVEVLVVDPENEYERLARAVGGTVIRFGAGESRLNPLDLAATGQPEALTEQTLFVHSLVHSLLGAVDDDERAALDAATLAAYERAGVTDDVRTHSRPAPLFGDVVVALTENEAGRRLAQRLAPFSTGSHRRLFDGPTTVRPEGHLVVLSLRDLPDELKSAGSLLALEAVWRRVARGERRPRIVVVDEAWTLLGAGREHGARFMQRLAKSARKHWCGLTTITQDADDVLSTDLGRSVVTNASSQILLGQSSQALEKLAHAFNLSAGEQAFLTSCDRGQGLAGIGTERAAVQFLASETEHRLATSTPQEIADLEASR